MTDIIGFAGSLSAPSRTRALVDRAVRQSAALSGRTSHVFDLGDLDASFGTAQRYADLGPKARDAVDRLIAADALVVGSPVYKGSYSGLFKHLFDLLDPDALKGKPVLLTATGGGHRHALVIEHQLRPLFGFFEAATLATGVYAASEDFDEGQPTSPALLARLQDAASQLALAIGTRGPARSRDLAYSLA
ncbi:FMN reductase [Celeribacter indicus]|uniref:NADPH-dependent FMN reductase n=1 Tax=Celeribacter indicus TaxID=1208324 RepID=A0A0B5DS27_9RHOB|nr:FMN reductase [Celeribacter indicus]AJE45844.1 NADPH-dependent FMN reductase [Celeribacter indicus]SDW62028.1 FMN reductase [Celeribacter indicus]